jgi:hypothetical protein
MYIHVCITEEITLSASSFSRLLCFCSIKERMKRLGAVQITQKHLAECLNVASGLSDSRRQAK